MEFDTCNGQPSTEFIETMVDMLKQTKGVEKFGLVEADDNIDKYNNAERRNMKRNMSDEPEDLPRGKKLDEKCSPKKPHTCNEVDKQTCEVIEVFTVDVLEHLEKVKSTSTEKIQELQAIIDSLDPTDNSNKLTIGTLTAQIAQIEMNRETSICSMNSLQSNKSGDIKIEKQRFCPSWSINLKYESFKKQLENWSQKNKNDETAKYYEVLETLKKNDKIPGLSDYVSGTVCDHFRDETEPTVAKLIDFLDNKYLKTAFERVDDLLDDFYRLRDKEEKDPAKFFDSIESLSKKFVEEKLNENPNFFFMCLLLK